MAEEKIWAVTAFVLQLNRIDPGPVLTAETARQIRIGAPMPTPSPDQDSGQRGAEASPTRAAPALRSEPEFASNDPAPLETAAASLLFAGSLPFLGVIGSFVYFKTKWFAESFFRKSIS